MEILSSASGKEVGDTESVKEKKPQTIFQKNYSSLQTAASLYNPDRNSLMKHHTEQSCKNKENKEEKGAARSHFRQPVL